MSGILTKAKDIYIGLRGFHTKRKLLIIESDDWGSIRTPSLNTLEKLKQEGDHPEKDAFLSNDSLESAGDLNLLYEALCSVRDNKGRPAVITANFATANPDFDKIDPQNEVYCYEPFYKTYQSYFPNCDMISIIKKGKDMGCFLPQLHCREHMNVNRWMNALKSGKSDAILAFNNRMIGVGASFAQDNIFGYMDAFNPDLTANDRLAEILNDGANIFFDVFGYRSESFVASCFVWSDALEDALKDQNIIGIQSSCWQNVPTGHNGVYKLKRRIRYTGQRNKHGQIYTVRNCSFEPAISGNIDNSVLKCLAEIDASFKRGKPAIINSHRLNYIGSINPENSRKNLEGLKNLLNRVVSTHPDVEFITTPELLKIIKTRRRNGQQ